ncbi:MAG TPA: LptF/LptG family permease [Gemmatimonadales bacterium]|nr:LptF/LptG family permease [Gemmatimonadales bacterium]
MARPTVRILTRYLLRQHVAPLGFALAALTALLLLNQVAKQLGQLVGKGLPMSVIVEVFLLSIPFIVAMTVPMAVLVAVLHATSRLAADNEITAMKASGISVARIVGPILAGAAVVAVVALAWNDQVLPRSNHRLRMLLVDITRKKPSFSLKEQVINEVLPGQFFLRAARIDPATNRLKNVTIYDLQDAERRRVISADSGRMAYTPGGRDLYLTLMDGSIQEVKRADAAQFNRTFFTVNRLRVAGIGNQLELSADDQYRGDREMSVCEMDSAVQEARLDAERAHLDARTAVENDLRRSAGLTAILAPTLPPLRPGSGVPYCRAFGALGRLLAPRTAHAQTPAKDRALHRRPTPPPLPTAQQSPAPPRPPAWHSIVPPHVSFLTQGVTTTEAQRVDGARRREAMYLVEIHKKFAIATACAVFALLGVPLALRFPRAGAGLVIGTSVVVFAIYYIGLIGGEDLGDRLIVSPFLAMWSPNLLFGAVGLAGLWAIRRDTGSTRGGDWADVRGLVRRLMPRRRVGGPPAPGGSPTPPPSK